MDTPSVSGIISVTDVSRRLSVTLNVLSMASLRLPEVPSILTVYSPLASVPSWISLCKFALPFAVYVDEVPAASVTVTVKSTSAPSASSSPFALTSIDGASPVMKFLLNMESTKKGSFEFILITEVPASSSFVTA